MCLRLVGTLSASIHLVLPSSGHPARANSVRRGLPFAYADFEQFLAEVGRRPEVSCRADRRTPCSGEMTAAADIYGRRKRDDGDDGFSLQKLFRCAEMLEALNEKRKAAKPKRPTRSVDPFDGA
jgi:hypothetical protein